MTKIAIEGIKDIGIYKLGTSTEIDFDQRSGSTSRLELSTKDAEYLYEKLKEKFS